ncbi:MAG TPA: TetR/AcrR family transcriptional regulator [Planctomycetota bacterium]|jgi:AcrR family transcriptional regulator|nr:TetR/AcrR family transcriptional regulator [Planctomycetota bacterium]
MRAKRSRPGRPSRFAEGRDRVLRAACRVFCRKGFDRASMREVAREAGVSLASLYYYARGKEDLLLRIQRECFEAVLRGLGERLEGLSDPEAKLRALVENHLGFFVSNMEAMKVLSREAETLRGARRAPIDDLKRRYVRIARDLVRDLERDRSRRRVDPAVAALGLFGMMNWVYTWYDPARDGDVRSLARAFGDLFLDGLRGRGRG